MRTVRITSMRLVSILGLGILLSILGIGVVYALEGRTGDRVVIGPDEVIDDDLYVGANEFVLEGTIKGDLIVGGSTIKILGTVEGDLWAAGQSIVIDGSVGDDVRIAGYSLSSSGDVADDFIGTAFSLEQSPDSTIGGDLLYGGYQAAINGTIGGDASLSGVAIDLAGKIAGNVTVDVGGADQGQTLPPGFPFAPNMPPVPSVSQGLNIDPAAEIGGNLRYIANQRASVPGGAVSGAIEYTEYVPEQPAAGTAPAMKALARRWAGRQIGRFLALTIVGALILWLAPGWTRQLADLVKSRPWASLGWGAVSIGAFGVAMIALVILTIVLGLLVGVVTLGQLRGRVFALGGILLSVLGFGFSVTWVYISKIVIALLIGSLIFGLFKSPAASNRWWSTLIGVVLLAVVLAVPVLNILVSLVIVLFGLGSVWLWVGEKIRGLKTPRVEAGVETA